jgi:sulfopyruvate decarboxylase alpha subunit
MRAPQMALASGRAKRLQQALAGRQDGHYDRPDICRCHCGSLSAQVVPDPREATKMEATTEDRWQKVVYDTLRKNGVSIFSYVPDAGHRMAIDLSLADPEVHSVALTTEEEGVALAAGAHLGGARSALLMQSSGLGNCINFFSMITGGKFPFLTVLSMRGVYGEGNPWQMGMGKATRPILDAVGFVTVEITRRDEVESAIDAACTMAFQSGEAVAVLLTQKLIGAKKF